MRRFFLFLALASSLALSAACAKDKKGKDPTVEPTSGPTDPDSAPSSEPSSEPDSQPQ
jgi:hypothetical protein